MWYLEGGRRYADSLYVGPPTLALLGRATGEQTYYEWMDEFFWDVHAELFDREEGLFYRDKRFIAKVVTALHTMLRMVAATRYLAVAPDTVVGLYARQRLVTVLRGPALDLGRSQVSLVTRIDSEGLPAVARFREALLAG